MMENEIVMERNKELEAENKRLRKGIARAYDAIHGWSWEEGITMTDVANKLKGLLEVESNGV